MNTSRPESTAGRCTLDKLIVSFYVLTKVSRSSTESGLVPMTRKLDPLNVSFSVDQPGVNVLNRKRVKCCLPMSASLNWHASLVDPKDPVAPSAFYVELISQAEYLILGRGKPLSK